jgi:hypothetical protein
LYAEKNPLKLVPRTSKGNHSWCPSPQRLQNTTKWTTIVCFYIQSKKR